jgi:hypothetical protein
MTNPAIPAGSGLPKGAQLIGGIVAWASASVQHADGTVDSDEETEEVQP